MRDPDRITEVIWLIRQIWEQEPDLRLCQLILNISKSQGEDLYYLEDEELINRLRSTYGHLLEDET